MSQHLKIEIEGCDGSEWVISGPGFGQQGVILKPKVSQLIDTPVKTLFVPGPFGEEFAGKRVQRREMVFTVQVGGEEIDPDEWAEIDAAWRWAWDYEKESTMTVSVLNADGSVESSRYIKLRLLEEPKSYGDRDPFIHGDDEVVMTVTATFPYWRSADRVYQRTNSGTLTIENDGDVPVWPRWSLSGGTTWTLPDYSWGNDMYSRGVEDAARTVQLPAIPAGNDVSVDSDPRVQTLICVNSTTGAAGFPAQHHWKGKDLLYPVMPGAGGTVQVSGTGSVVLYLPRWYSRPWSKPVAL